MDRQKNDIRFRPTGMAAPITFLLLFVIFVYGALFLGLMGIANWIVHEWSLTFFLNPGIAGTVLMVFCLLAGWSAAVFGIAAIPFYFLRASGHPERAGRIAEVIIFLLFNILMLPFILWPMVRNASPKLRAGRRAKLRQMAEIRKKQRS